MLSVTTVHDTVSEILICSANSLAEDSQAVKIVSADTVVRGSSTQLQLEAHDLVRYEKITAVSMEKLRIQRICLAFNSALVQGEVI